MLAARDDAGVVAFDFERIVQQAGADLESGFNQTDIFVAGPEQGLNATADLYA